MFYLDKYPNQPNGFNSISTSAEWMGWVYATVPNDTDGQVQERLVSNLKHVLVGLEMKAGLIVPHCERISNISVLFEPYCQILTFEFCVGVFSICEGVGSIHYLSQQGDDGTSGAHVKTEHWINALIMNFDPDGTAELETNVQKVKSVRDKMHQDRLGARENIDWHDFGFEQAFLPARSALQPLLIQNQDVVPDQTNLLVL